MFEPLYMTVSSYSEGLRSSGGRVLRSLAVPAKPSPSSGSWLYEATYQNVSMDVDREEANCRGS